MNPFRDNVFYLLVWRATLVSLVAIVLMTTSGLSLGVALLVGAHVALLFSLGLMFWVDWLDESRIAKIDAWRMLTPGQRPAGVAGRRWARRCHKEVGLQFAKAGSVIAVALATSALVLVSE
jgi:hypothetical protein